MLQTFYIPAGGRIVNALARFLRYESASAGGADESLRVRADGNDLGTYLPGDSIKLPINAKTWELTPVTATATAIVRLGVGGVDSSRIFGNVRIIDSGADKTMLGKQFHGSTTAPVDAANCSIVNLQANGVTVAVRSILVQSDVAGDVMLGSGTAAGTATPLGGAGPMNKLINGPVPTHRMGNGIAAGATPTVGELPGWVARARVFIPANVPTLIPLSMPLVVNGTNVLVLHGLTINRRVSWVLETEEI